MSYTNLPHGAACMGVPIIGGGGHLFQGSYFFMLPVSGIDAQEGKTLSTAKKTLAGVLSAMTADKNDVCYFFGEGNSASECTDYQSSTLDWNKDCCHLIGRCAGGGVSNRARIALISTYVTASNLMTVSANACRFENLSFFEGVADTHPTGCLKVTGDRNVFVNCHIAGIGNDNNDIANAYSLYLSGSENHFINCVIGLDTVSRGSADNAELVLAGGGARNKFTNCYFITFASANTHQFVKKAASGIDRWVIFENCHFVNCVQSTGVSMLEAFDVTAGGSPNGLMYLINCSLLGCADWEAATVSGEVYSFATTSTGNVTGLAVAVAAS